MKAKLEYTIRTTRAPGADRDTIVPVLVDRLQPTDLEAIVEKCIDRGLIAGLKPTAAQTIATGVAEQLAKEFMEGHGVAFGQYFYGRPYLSGTVDENGRLTSANSINVRLYKGGDFKLTLGDFSFTFAEGGDLPKIDFITSEGNGTRGEVVKGSFVQLNGSMLWAAGDSNKVKFEEAGSESEAIVVDTFRSQGPSLLAFDAPAALVAGKRYNVTVERKDANNVVTYTNTKAVLIVEGATPPGPSTAPSIDNVLQEGEGEGNLNKIVSKDKTTNINGANFDGASVTVEYLDHEDEPASFSVGATKMEINEEGTVIAVDPDVLYEVADRKGEGNITFKVTTSEGETSKEVAWEVSE